MVSSFTPNINLEEPARGDDVGTWDTPVNANMTVIDLVVGANAPINISAGNVTLSAAQFQSRLITLASTLLANTSITFPSTFKKDYMIRNTVTASSAFFVTLTTTVSGGEVIGVPPGKTSHVYNDGTNLRFLDLPPVGTYWDYAGSSTPNWNDGCTVPPWLNCNSTTFSATVYPALAGLIGTTTPDSRGRARYALDGGVGRVSSAVSGVAGNTLFGSGGDQSLQSHTHTNSLTDPGHVHAGVPVITGTGGGGGFQTVNGTGNSASATTGITITNASAGSGSAQNMPPVYVGGITMIRAA